MRCKLQKIVKGPMGAVEFEAQFAGMRKAQDWIIYKPESNPVRALTIQSDTRIGRICLDSGRVSLSAAKAGGARFVDLPHIKQVDQLEQADLCQLKQFFPTAAAPGVVRIW